MHPQCHTATSSLTSVTPSINFSFTQIAAELQIYRQAWLGTTAKRAYVAYVDKITKSPNTGRKVSWLLL